MVSFALILEKMYEVNKNNKRLFDKLNNIRNQENHFIFKNKKVPINNKSVYDNIVRKLLNEKIENENKRLEERINSL